MRAYETGETEVDTLTSAELDKVAGGEPVTVGGVLLGLGLGIVGNGIYDWLTSDGSATCLWGYVGKCPK